MKRFFIVPFLLLLVFLSYSCNESINPNAPFRERFILNGIMRNDTSYQTVTLTHSYQPGNGEPYSYEEDPAITNAEVNIYYKNELYHMSDTSITRTDTSHYTTPFHFYYNDKLKPDPNETIEINALLPNGLLLQSIVKTPDVSNIGFFDSSSDKLIPKQDDPRVNISWRNLGDIIYSPNMYITYFIKGDSTEHRKKLPIFYLDKGDGTSEPVYLGPSKNNFIALDMPTIQKTLLDIPPEGASKNDYAITGITVELLVYDEFISKYYSSIKQGLDGFTVKLDSPDYTNIKGGFGIFGSVFKTQFDIKINFDYLESLGFR